MQLEQPFLWGLLNSDHENLSESGMIKYNPCSIWNYNLKQTVDQISPKLNFPPFWCLAYSLYGAVHNWQTLDQWFLTFFTQQFSKASCFSVVHDLLERIKDKDF